MRAPVSAVIPTLEAAGRIGPCLAALAEGAVEGVLREVVIADGGSSDAIAEVAEAVGARLVTAPRGRGTQLRAGIAEASADWLLVVHADTVLAPGWSAPVLAHIAAGEGRAAYGRLRFESTATMARVTERWANLRSRLFAMPYGDQGLLIHRSLYDAVGGYPAQPLFEDVEIARRLGRARLAPLEVVATTSPERYEREGWMLRGARNMVIVTRYLMGGDPERLSRRYRRR